MVYSDYDPSFNKLLEMANKNTIYVMNIHILMTEIYKFLNGIAPAIRRDIFKKGLSILLKKPKIIKM